MIAALTTPKTLPTANWRRWGLLSAGPLQPLLDDDQVTDVLVHNGQVWIDRGAGLCRVEVDLGGEAAIRRLAQRLAAACGRRLDDAQPWVDARLPDGTRLHAMLPPIAVAGVALSLRTFRRQPFSLAELVAIGTVDPQAALFIRAMLIGRLSYVVTGGTASGKTTLLASLLGELPINERLVIIEDVTELAPRHPHVVSLQARWANSEGAGEVNLRELIRQALRMRPDRIVVGECRGGELVDLLAALNTGHDGSAGTVHANSPSDVVARLEALGALGGLSTAALHSQLGASIHCVLHVRRSPRGRQLAEIAVFRADSSGRMYVSPAWRLDGSPCPGAPVLHQWLAARGVAVGGQS